MWGSKEGEKQAKKISCQQRYLQQRMQRHMPRNGFQGFAA
jgi:hypothetical protein